MNWLLIGVVHLAIIAAILVYGATRAKFNRSMLLIALAHVPFIILNLVAPIRGFLDPGYAGYRFGILEIPPGFGVTLVAGTVIWGSVFIAYSALSGKLRQNIWFAIILDFLILGLISIPVLAEGIMNPADFRLELGEYFQVSGWIVLVILSAILMLPLVYTLTQYIRLFREQKVLSS